SRRGPVTPDPRAPWLRCIRRSRFPLPRRGVVPWPPPVAFADWPWLPSARESSNTGPFDCAVRPRRPGPWSAHRSRHGKPVSFQLTSRGAIPMKATNRPQALPGGTGRESVHRIAESARGSVARRPKLTVAAAVAVVAAVLSGCETAGEQGAPEPAASTATTTTTTTAAKPKAHTSKTKGPARTKTVYVQP